MDRKRFVEAFFNFRRARSIRCLKCRYNNKKHYTDEVFVRDDGRKAEYMLHGRDIAVLTRCDNDGVLMLRLDNHGIETRLFTDTLNLILKYLKDELGVGHGVSYHLKYKYGSPDIAYIRYDEKTYLAIIPSRVTISFMRGVKRPINVDLGVIKDDEIYFFKDHPELRSIYKLYRKLSKLDDEVKELYNKYKDYKGGVDPDTYKAVKDMFKKMYGEDVDDAYDDFVRVSLTYNIATYKWGFEYYGVFARYIDDNDYATVVKNILNGEIAFAKYVADKLKRMLTIAKLVH